MRKKTSRIAVLAIVAGFITLGTGDQGWATAPQYVQEALLLAKPSSEYRIRVAAYNAFLRPSVVDTVLGFRDRAPCRAKLIGATLSRSDFDVVALSEMHHTTAVDNLREALGASFGVRLFGKPESFEGVGFRPVHGGLSLLSRYAVEQWYAEGYETCSGVDCLARKGFVHAVLRLSEGIRLNVVMTHANAGAGPEAEHARMAQFAELGLYLRSNPSFGKWPTVLLGDLNLKGRLEGGAVSKDYREAMNSLLIPSLGLPTDPFLSEALANSHEVAATENCSGSRLIPCVRKESTSGARHDFILFWSSPSVQVKAENLRVEAYADAEARCGTPYLSDHAAPVATLVLQPSTADRRSPKVQHASVL